MSVPVPSRFDGTALAGCRTAAPVSYGQAASWASGLAFLHGAVLHCVGSQAGLPLANGTIRLGYFRSTGARALLVVVEFNVATAITDRVSCDVVLTQPSRSPGEAAKVAGTLLGTTTALDGATDIPCPTARQRVAQEYARVFNLETTDGIVFTTDTLLDLTITTSSAVGTTFGIARYAVYEIPRTALVPEVQP